MEGFYRHIIDRTRKLLAKKKREKEKERKEGRKEEGSCVRQGGYLEGGGGFKQIASASPEEG